MNYLLPFTRTLVFLACLGLIMPGTVLQAAQPADGSPRGRQTSSATLPVSDVELDAEGRLQGAVINVQGVPVAMATVVVWQDGREVARTAADALGCFSVNGLRGGTYLISVGNSAKPYRTWVTQTAPPKTSPLALIIVGGDVVRGQVPLGCFFCSDAIVIAGMVGAIIAIPIAVHQSRDDDPSSP